MKWPVALSFSQTDYDLAAGICGALRMARVGCYFYGERRADEAGSLLLRKHSDIYDSASIVAFFLRGDFLDRQYTRLEYETVNLRADRTVSSIYFLCEPSASWLVPLEHEPMPLYDSSGLLSSSCAIATRRILAALD